MKPKYRPSYNLMSQFVFPSKSKMNVFAFATNWILLITLIVHRVDGFPNGAPTAACSTMKPGHSLDPQPIATSPFFTHISNGENVLMDNIVHLELRARNGVTTFKGFLIMAFDKEDNSSTSTPIGTFHMPSNGKLISCNGHDQNAVTHAMNNDKKSVKVDWIRPKNFAGQVVFRTTFVQEFNTFWVKTESKIVSFVTNQPIVTSELFATQSTSNSIVSTTTASTQPFTVSAIIRDPASQSILCWIMNMNMMNIRHLGFAKDRKAVLKDLRCVNVT